MCFQMCWSHLGQTWRSYFAISLSPQSPSRMCFEGGIILPEGQKALKPFNNSSMTAIHMQLEKMQIKRVRGSRSTGINAPQPDPPPPPTPTPPTDPCTSLSSQHLTSTQRCHLDPHSPTRTLSPATKCNLPLTFTLRVETCTKVGQPIAESRQCHIGAFKNWLFHSGQEPLDCSSTHSCLRKGAESNTICYCANNTGAPVTQKGNHPRGMFVASSTEYHNKHSSLCLNTKDPPEVYSSCGSSTAGGSSSEVQYPQDCTGKPQQNTA